MTTSSSPGLTARSEFHTSGVALFEAAADQECCDRLLPDVDEVAAGARISQPSPFLSDLIAPTGQLGRLAVHLAGTEARPVRILAFDKSPSRNWSLGWHQDRVIAVKERIDMPGYGNWTEKAGVPHVEPPEDVLQQVFSLRLHLDDCDEDNGALQVVPGSWRHGRVDEPTMQRLLKTSATRTCPARRGDVLAMRALTFHASDAALHPTRRRVLHVDFASCTLPTPLAWFFSSEDRSTKR